MPSFILITAWLAAGPATAQVDALRDPNAKPVEEMTVNANRLNQQLEQASQDAQEKARQNQRQIEQTRKANDGTQTQDKLQAGGRNKAQEVVNGWRAPPPVQTPAR